jgi:hypothetical protein
MSTARHRHLFPLLELFAAAALAVAARLWFLAVTGVTYEDSLISLRYARNYSEGWGLVYNPGERVFGATTPLYVLLLSGLFQVGLPDPLMAARLLSVLADGLTAALWYSLIRRETGSRAGAFTFAVAFGLSPFMVEVAVSGMETSLLLLGFTLAFEALYSRRGWVLGLWLGLMLLLRLDSALFIVILLAARALRERRVPLREAGVMATVAAPWFLFSLFYYGSIIPNSIPAKLNAYNIHLTSLLRPLYFTISHFTPIQNGWKESLFAALFLPLFLFGAQEVLRRRRVMLPVLLFFAVHWAFLVLPRSVIFRWYLPPLLLPYYVVGGIGVAALLRRHAMTDTRPALRHALCIVLVGGLMVHTGHWLTAASRRVWAIQAYEDGIRKSIGLWLARNTAPNAVISLEPIGYIGYYSRRRIVDEVGLVTPGVIPHTRRGAGWFTRVVRQYQPDYVVERPHFLTANKTILTDVPMFASPAERDWFWANYRPIREYPASGPRLYRRTFSFVILQRRSLPVARSHR